MLTQVLIVSSVDNIWIGFITKAMPSYLDYMFQGSLVPMSQRYATCVSLFFFRGLLIANSTYSIQIHEIASTKMIPLCNCHKYC